MYCSPPFHFNVERVLMLNATGIGNKDAACVYTARDTDLVSGKAGGIEVYVVGL